MSTVRRPDLRVERGLLRAGARVLVGMDEVGRGALAGPVSVGAVAVDLSTRSCPSGVADSKLLRPAAREALLPALARWGLARAVGHASAAEIDHVGIIAALRLAGRRALAALVLDVDAVLLDGSHDWLSHAATLFAPDDDLGRPRVHVLVRADQSCSSVAAASILAKCERDALMTEHHVRRPGYGWAANKGYGAPDHLEALAALGPSELHRLSWRLPGAGVVPSRAQPGRTGRPADRPSSEAGAGTPARWSMMDR